MKVIFKAVKLVFTLLIYNIRKPKRISILNDYYPGINKEETPLKVFIPKRPSKHHIIIYPGASPYAEEHPGMIMLGSLLANLGYRTYMPRIPLLKELIINEEIVTWFEHFYLWLLKEKRISSKNISLIGMSFGGAMTLKMSIQKSIENFLPKSIFVYGSYYDLKAGLEFIVSGKIIIKGKTRKIEPNPWGLIVMFHNYLSRVDVGYDTIQIQNIISLRIQDNEKEVVEELKKITGKKKELINCVLNGKMNSEVLRIIKIFDKIMVNEYSSLSPSHWYEKVTSKVFIFHGANDTMVPFTESINLAKKIKQSKLFISYLYEHREISSNKGYFFKGVEIIKMVIFLGKFIKYNED